MSYFVLCPFFDTMKNGHFGVLVCVGICQNTQSKRILSLKYMKNQIFLDLPLSFCSLIIIIFPTFYNLIYPPPLKHKI